MTTIPPNPEEALVTIGTPKSDTVRVRDRVESSRFEFYFDEDVDIEATSTEQAYFPVDVAAKCSWEGQSLDIPILSSIYVFDYSSGQNIAVCDETNPEIQLPQNGSILEVVTAPMKIYLCLDRGGGIVREKGVTTVNTKSDTSEIILFSRSLHEKPAGTITIQESVKDLMDAVSHFGSALKTTTPERAWPTLRGYPPKIEIGERFHAPKSTEPPDVDVRIEIPADTRSLFEVTPLAYYCAAEVVEAPSRSSAALVTDGKRVKLVAEQLGRSASALLQKFFALDCVVRTAGFYPAEVTGYDKTVSKLPWSIDDAYDAPIGERLAKYSEVPEDAISEMCPIWPLTADIKPAFDNAPALSHLAEELAVIRASSRDTPRIEDSPEYLKGFMRTDGGLPMGSRNHSESPGTQNSDIMTPDPWPSQLHTFLKDGYPLGSNKTSIGAYERHLERAAPETSTIEVHVVCNDDEMREEEIVTEFYGVRDLLEFRVHSHYNLSTSALRDLFKENFDLLHFIGHNDEAGIKCPDGYLDIRTDVQEVNIQSFILNACRSVEQAKALLEKGAHGGICTLYDIPNSSATKVGRTLSRLLNRGFNLRSALEIARETSVLGRRWISIGDGRLALTQPESGVPQIVEVTSADPGFKIEIEWFETLTHRLGAVTSPNTSWGGNYIMPGKSDEIVTESELEEFLSLEVMPIRYGGELYWSDEISPGDLVSNMSS